MTQERIVELIRQALREWDRVHSNGINRDYMTTTPSYEHLAARMIMAEIGDHR